MICPECDVVCAPLASSDAKVMSDRLYHVPTKEDEHSATIIDAANLLLVQSSCIADLRAALVGLVLACDVDDVYEDDSGDRPAMVAARAAIRKE